MSDITKEHYENKNYVDKYVEIYLSYKGYEEDYAELTRLLPKNALILDAGCGPGREALIFTKYGFKPVGVDYSNTMVEKAKEIAPNCQFLVMDLRKLEFEDNYFDGIWSTGVLAHFNENELKRVLNEFRRVLKPNGIIFICTREGKKRDNGGKEPVLEGGEVIINYYEKEKFAELLKSSGFEIISTEVSEDDTGRGFNWIAVFAKMVSPSSNSTTCKT